MSEVDINLQGVNRLANETLDKIAMFEKKLRLWELQLRSKHMTRFQILRTEKEIRGKNSASTRIPGPFSRSKINLFSLPFDVNVETSSHNSNVDDIFTAR
jgi:hypothetical protein